MHGVIFDFDGVLVPTHGLHYLAWQQIAGEEGMAFDRQANARLLGLGRMESLEVLLELDGRRLDQSQQLALAERKNAAFLRLAGTLTPDDVLPGVVPLLAELTARGIKKAVASSSRNVRLVMNRVGLAGRFDAVVDGNDVRQTKPHPEPFLLAARSIGLAPETCVVIEDSRAGIEAAHRAGMAVLGVGATEALRCADRVAPDLVGATVDTLAALPPGR